MQFVVGFFNFYKFLVHCRFGKESEIECAEEEETGQNAEDDYPFFNGFSLFCWLFELRLVVSILIFYCLRILISV